MLKKILTTLSVILFSTAYASLPTDGNIDRIIIFGDSLSDNGNTFELSSIFHEDDADIPLIPAPDLYWHGRFSNGPVWNEFLAGLLHFMPERRTPEERRSAHYLNYAYGGAWAESYQPDADEMMRRKRKMTGVWHTLPPSLEGQVDNYLADQEEYPAPIDHDLMFIWVGGNDYLNQQLTGIPIARLPEISTNTVLNDLKENIEKLVQAGAKHFVIFGLPDLSQVPNVSLHDPAHTSIAPALSGLSLLHNQKLQQLIATLKTNYPNVDWTYVDINALFLGEFGDAAKRAIAYQQLHAGQSQRASTPCILEDVDPDPTTLNLLTRNPILAMTTSRKKALRSTPSYRHCDLHVKEDQASPFGYDQNYLAGGIFFDHIHPLTQVHAKIALKVCEQLFTAGYQYSLNNNEYIAVNCAGTEVNALMTLIDNPTFPTIRSKF